MIYLMILSINYSLDEITAAVNFIELIMKSIASGKNVVGVYMAISKGFYSVRHGMSLLVTRKMVSLSVIINMWGRRHITSSTQKN